MMAQLRWVLFGIAIVSWGTVAVIVLLRRARYEGSKYLYVGGNKGTCMVEAEEEETEGEGA